MSGLIGISPNMKSGIIGGEKGKLLSSTTFTWADGDVAMTDGNGRIGKEFVTHNLASTNTYVITWTFGLYAWRSASSNFERRAYIVVCMHTSDPGNPGDIFNGGTRFREGQIGRNLIAADSSTSYTYAQFCSRNVVPYGTSGTQYFGIVAGADGANNRTTLLASGNNHMSLVIEEYKGDIDDRTT